MNRQHVRNQKTLMKALEGLKRDFANEKYSRNLREFLKNFEEENWHSASIQAVNMADMFPEEKEFWKKQALKAFDKITSVSEREHAAEWLLSLPK